jgi:hypothetical protein
MDRNKLIELGVLEDVVDAVVEEISKNTKSSEQDSELRAQLDEANKKLTEFEGMDGNALRAEFTVVEERYKQEIEDLKQQLADMEYANVLNKFLSQYNFTSEFMRRAIEAVFKDLALPLENGVIIGAEEHMKKLISENAGIIKDRTPVPQIIVGGSSGKPRSTTGVEELFYEKNPKLR